MSRARRHPVPIRAGRTTRIRLTAALAAGLIFVAGCGDSGDNDGAPSDDQSAGSDASVSQDSDSTGTGGAVPETAGSTTTADGPKRGGRLNIGLPYDWASLDPLRIGTVASLSPARAVYDTLLEFNAESQLEPGLASAWETPDDGKTWVVTLRPGVQFHDGTLLDSTAVKVHADRLNDPDNACLCQSLLDSLESVEAPSEYEVVFNLTEPLAWFPSVLAGEFGMIPSPAAVDEFGDDFGNNPVGTGPFKFMEQQPGSSVTFERFDEYWRDEMPYLDAITFRVLPDPESRLADLRTGGIDVMMQPGTEHWKIADEDPEIDRIEIGGIGSHFILMNNMVEPFDDVRARRALALALDLETLHETVNDGVLKPATSIFNPGTWAYPGEIENYPLYDLEAAKSLVEELGGLQFTLSIYPAVREAAVAAQAMWADAGIEVEIMETETNVLVAAGREGQYEAIWLQFAGRADPGVFAYRFYHSASTTGYTGVNDAELDRLVTEGQETLDQSERKQIYADLARRAAEVLPFALLSNINQSYLVSSDVRGILPTPDEVIRPATVWLDR